MKKFLIFCVFVVGVFVSSFIFPEGAVATLFATGICIITFLTIDRIFDEENAEYLKRVFLLAVAARVFLAIIIYTMEWENIFGPDAATFDTAGRVLNLYWLGLLPADSPAVEKYASFIIPGWGMNYLVGILYYLSGRNPLAIQFVSCSLGASVVPIIYYCTGKIFLNTRAARYSALVIAFYPAMIIFSAQMLKDGIIVFLLAMSIACVIRLSDRIDPSTITVLVLSLLGLLTMRFYIFYMVLGSVIGGIVVGSGKTSESIGKRLALILLFGTLIGYLGISGSSTGTIDEYADLDRLQTYRYYQAEGTGFNQEADITSIEGTATLLPVGIVNILFAPFPWQMENARQAVVLPEMIFWWGCIPFLITGLIYTVKNRLKSSISVLTFTAMLTITYAIVQSNIGAAYRQRTQIQVFLFIFIAVGWAIYKEKRENKHTAFRSKLRRNLART